jgi:hypothetical protein
MYLDRPTIFHENEDYLAGSAYKVTSEMVWASIQKKININYDIVKDFIIEVIIKIPVKYTKKDLEEETERCALWIIQHIQNAENKPTVACKKAPSAMQLPKSTLSTSELGSRF